MTEQRPFITLVQRVPDAAAIERQIGQWYQDDRWRMDLASHLRGNLAANADAVLVDGPTLRDVLEKGLAASQLQHEWYCAKVPCTCWRAKAKAMLESLKGTQP